MGHRAGRRPPTPPVDPSREAERAVGNGRGATADASPPSLAMDGLVVEAERPRRVRLAGDAVRLALGLALLGVGLLLATVAEQTVEGLEADLVEGFAQLPDRFQQVLVGLGQVVALTVLTAIAGVLLLQRRLRRLAELALAAAAAATAMTVLGQALAERGAIDVLERPSTVTGWVTGAGFPDSPYLAAAAAVVTMASVWFSRPWKRAAWTALGVLAVLRMITWLGPTPDLVLALAVGIVVASLVLVVFGAPNPDPSPEHLAVAVRRVAPHATRLRRAHAEGGTRAWRVEVTDGTPAFVRMRTPDDRSADLLNRSWRSLRLRRGEVDRPYATVKRRVEHEALLLLRAVDAGVAAPHLLGVATTPDGSVLLGQTWIDGRRLVDMEPDEVDDALLARVWTEVRALHGGGMAHRDLALSNVLVDPENRPHLVDFDEAVLAAPEQERRKDTTALLVDLALLVGVERAVGSAVTVLGPEHVAAVLPLLQPLALPSETRRRVRRQRDLLDHLTAEVRAATGAAAMELERLERLRPRTVLAIVAGAVAFYVLLPQLADLEQTLDAFASARWRWLPVVLTGSALTYVFATVAFVGSVPERVPLGPAFRAQLASSFASRVTPASAGAVAVGIRFLQRAGVDSATATAAVGLNQVAGVVVHLTLMALFFSWTGRSEVGGFSLPGSTTVLAVVAVVLAVAGLALLVGPVRRLVLPPALRAARSAAVAVTGVVTSPGRVAALFGGSAGITLSYLLSLVASLEAFGGGLTVPEIGAAYLGAALLASAAPTPGGLGALEAALVAALVGFGLGSGVAVSAVLTHRLATFWLPVLPGWVAFQWMQRRGEL